MNIEKIKNYNQKLLAVLGTVVILFAVLGLISTFAFLGIELSSTYNRNQDEGILSNEEVEELQEDNKRKQVISYEIPQLVDTINLVYLVPVSHKTLNGTENINDGVLGIVGSGSYKKSDYRYSTKYYGNYNNLLIYDYKENIVKKLFNERVNFGKITTKYFDDDILIFLEVAKKDTYKDGIINLEDLKLLCIYSLKEKKLREITYKNTDILQFSFIKNSKNLLIQFGIDKNKNGKYNQYKEPAIIKKYNFKTDELNSIITENIEIELQNKLEGTK